MNFFKTIIEICKGTKIFLELKKYSLRKTLGYTTLLILICSFFIAIPQTQRVNTIVSDITSKLSDHFGQFTIEKDGIYTTFEREKNKSLITKNHYRIDYIFDYNVNIEELKNSICSEGLIWTPKALLSWMKKDGELFFLNNPFLSLKKRESIFTEVTLLPFLAEVAKEPYDSIIETDEILNFEDFNSPILIFTFLFLGYNFLPMLFVNITYMLIFSLMHTFLNAKISLKQIKKQFIINTFISLPGVLIASFFPAFELGFDYTTILLSSFVLYSFPVYVRLTLEKSKECSK